MLLSMNTAKRSSTTFILQIEACRELCGFPGLLAEVDGESWLLEFEGKSKVISPSCQKNKTYTRKTEGSVNEEEARVFKLLICLCQSQNNAGSYVSPQCNSKTSFHETLSQTAHLWFITKAFYLKCSISQDNLTLITSV